MVVSLFSVPSNPEGVWKKRAGEAATISLSMWCWAVTLWPVSGGSGRLGVFPGGFSDIHDIFHGLLARFQDLLKFTPQISGIIWNDWKYSAKYDCQMNPNDDKQI